jgi:hypothetical protein
VGALPVDYLRVEDVDRLLDQDLNLATAPGAVPARSSRERLSLASELATGLGLPWIAPSPPKEES